MDPAPGRTAYLIAGRRLEADSADFAEAIAAAYASRHRPRCMCQDPGIEMYVACLVGAGRVYIVKRMPYTGSRHAPDCPSYEPPPEVSGLGQVLGTAVAEDPATGTTTLKLNFALARGPGRSTAPAAAADTGSVSSAGTKLSLRGLLHYLWDQAELTRWHPGFAGKRTWSTIRRHLLRAAENKLVRGDPLNARLYVPETFSVEQREPIATRRGAQWSRAIAAPRGQQRLMLMIAEVKEIMPARYGFRAVIRHVPDQAFALDEQLYRQLDPHFETELALWGAAEDIHLMMIATFGVGATGVPAITELSLMAVTRQWLPVEDGFDRQLVEQLVRDGRSFVKGLRYNLRPASALASATLTDCGAPAPLLFIVPADRESMGSSLPIEQASTPAWLWHPAAEAMPPLPPPRACRLTQLERTIES